MEEIEEVDIGILTPHPMNARVHSKQNIRAIMISLATFGQQQVLVVDSKNRVVVGSGRLEAMRRLSKLPAHRIYELVKPTGKASVLHTKWNRVKIVRTALAEKQALAYSVADNRTTDLSRFDTGKLRVITTKLADQYIGSMGFDEAALTQMKKDSAAMEDVRIIEAPKPGRIIKVSRGDIWKIGPHYIGCGDCTDRVFLQKVTKSERVHICCTDPPWGVDYGDARARQDIVNVTNIRPYSKPKIVGDAMSAEDYMDFCHKYVSVILDTCLPGAHLYIFIAGRTLYILHQKLLLLGAHYSNILVWYKQHYVMSLEEYHHQHELIWYGWKKGRRLHPLTDRKQSDVWSTKKVAIHTLHPMAKPVELFEKAISNSSSLGDKVLDPFLGTGSCGIACARTRRVLLGIEIDETFAGKAVAALEEECNESAVRVHPSSKVVR
jgi:DNA modification methylase